MLNLNVETMKKYFMSFVCAVITIACVSFALLVQFNSGKLVVDNLLLENVEALTRGEIGEVVVTCSKGSSGQCFTRSLDLKLCGEYSYYACVYTGYTRDNCTIPC